MASGYRYDDARPTGGTYGSSRGMDPDVTPYGRTRLSEDRREPIRDDDARYGAASHEGDRYRDKDFGYQNSRYQDDHRGSDQRGQGYPERWSRDEGADYDDDRRDSAHRDPHYQDARYSDHDYRDEHRGSAGHRDSEHEAPYYGDARYHDDYQAPGYGHRARGEYDDEGAGSGRHGERGGYRDGFDDHDGGYHRGMDDPNAGYEEQAETGMETRRVSREELELPPLRRRGGAPEGPSHADERPTLDVPVQRRDSRPAPPPAADSTVVLPRQSGRSDASDPGSARTQYVPRAAAAAAGVGATRARADDASTKVIRNPEDLPRIDIPGASDDQATQLFQRPDDMGRPVFVDSSGKRGKYLRVLVQVFGVLCLIFLVGIVASLAIPSAMRAQITGTQESPTPTPTKASTAPTPKRSAPVVVAPPAATTSARKPSTKPSVSPTRARVSPTPTEDDNDNGNLPTTIPTLGPTTPAATTADADPTTDAPNNNKNN